ncbi:MAG TPA: NAD(P)/FAD-dependent oxidoreductase [Polyangiaceae bacterium]|nr:NAD(P)/FAD-dependent oxidoreductase [Polyangiaceae bacterium]
MFARLRELLGSAISRHRDAARESAVAGGDGETCLEPPGLHSAWRGTRRDWLGAQAGLAAGAVTACANQESGGTPIVPPDEPRVAIVGGGVAGLTCAYWLNQAKIDVSVYEANSTRVGGRAFTGRELFSNSALTCEFGAEFVEPHHAAVWALAHELDVTIEPRQTAGAGRVDFFWLEGKQVPLATLLAQLAAVSDRISRALLDANADAGRFFLLDNTSLGNWLSENIPARDYPELSLALGLAYRGEFGLDVEQLSALNLLHLVSAAVKPQDPKPSDPAVQLSYGLFGQAQSTYRLRGGADTLAQRLAEGLLGRVKLDSQLISIERSGQQHSLTFQSRAGGGFAVAADRVVLALPFSTLRQVPLDELALPADVRDVILTLGYGSHCRTVGAFDQILWRGQGYVRGSVASDLPFEQAADANISSEGTREGLLGNTVSGSLASAARDADVQTSYRAALDALQAIFPGIKEAYQTESARRVHWEKLPFSRGSRSCRKPGQWASRAVAQTAQGHLRFCGEHCSIDFPGTLEGAAETGALVAGQLILELGHKLPPALQQLLQLKSRVLQPCCDLQETGSSWPVVSSSTTEPGSKSDPNAAYDVLPALDGTKLGFLERLSAVLESHTAFTRQFM